MYRNLYNLQTQFAFNVAGILLRNIYTLQTKKLPSPLPVCRNVYTLQAYNFTVTALH